MKILIRNAATLCLSAFSALIASQAIAQTEAITVERAQYFNQTGPSTVTPQQMPFSFAMYIRASTANWGPALFIAGSVNDTPQTGTSSDTNTGTLNFPASPNNGTGYMFTHDFATNAAMEAFYPIAPTGGGQYGVKFLGASAPSPAIFTDGLVFGSDTTYPSVVPQVSSVDNGAVWSAGALRVQPTGITTLTINSFPEYSSTPYGSLIGVGVYATNSSEGGIVGEASLESYYLPLGDSTETPNPVNQSPITQVTVDGEWLEPGVNYTLELQYSVIASRPEEAVLNSREFQGLATYRRITMITLSTPPTQPVITIQPTTRYTTLAHNAYFSVKASGGSLQYQWRRNGVNLTNGGAFSGVNTARLTIANVQAANQGSYDVVITNPVGNVTSHAVPLTVVERAVRSDFNNDGKSDLVWHNRTSGEIGFWVMNGMSVGTYLTLTTVTSDWLLAANADFDGDGQVDLVFSNAATGERRIWLMDGVAKRSEVSLGTRTTEWEITGADDFNGDGKADIFWQNSVTGERGIWVMNETVVGSYVTVTTLGNEWQVAATGDFNGDGKADIVWQNTISGERGMWLMNGTSVGTYIKFADVGTEWSIMGAADYDRDGKLDIVWQNAISGERGMWLMSGTQVNTYIAFATVGTEWTLNRIPYRRAPADFNADNNPDIILTNTSNGERGFWVMNGTTVSSYTPFATVGTEWRIAGSADFNADSKADIIWENTNTGERGFWIMNGTSVGTFVSFATVGTEWRIAGSADFNADNKADIIWENTITGERGFWIMLGTSVGTYMPFATVGTEWRIAGAADFNGDYKPDIIWENTNTGERGFWVMNGLSVGYYQSFATLATNWELVGAADFNRDGKPDIIRQNTSTGERGVWYMDGMTAGTYQAFSQSIGTSWTIGN